MQNWIYSWNFYNFFDIYFQKKKKYCCEYIYYSCIVSPCVWLPSSTSPQLFRQGSVGIGVGINVVGDDTDDVGSSVGVLSASAKWTLKSLPVPWYDGVLVQPKLFQCILQKFILWQDINRLSYTLTFRTVKLSIWRAGQGAEHWGGGVRSRPNRSHTCVHVLP